MRPRNCLLAVQLGILAALSASAALLVDHLGATPAYCHGDSGCAVAREFAMRWLGPVPMPLLGLLAFGALLALTLSIRSPWARRLLVLGGAIAGAVGVALLAAQALVLKRFCPLCVVVDLLAVSVAVAALLWRRNREVANENESLLRPIAAMGFALIAVIAPVTWPHLRPAVALPAVLEPYQVAGKTTLIEFVDLECMHCRALYPTLEQLQRELGSEVAQVRLHVPFQSHPQARKAARLLECQRESAIRERLERRFFEAQSLTLQHVIEMAQAEGISEPQVVACLSEPDTERAIAQNTELFHKLGRFGLPTTFVGGERIAGAMPKSVYRAAVDKVRRSPEMASAQVAAFFGIVALLLAAVYVVGNRRQSSAPIRERKD